MGGLLLKTVIHAMYSLLSYTLIVYVLLGNKIKILFENIFKHLNQLKIDL